MTDKRALIFGVSGQDGSYLTELLESKGYEVWGTLRRHAWVEGQDHWLKETKIQTIYADVTDPHSVVAAVRKAQPQEIYNLAGQAQVRISFDKPYYTIQVNGVGVLNVLEAMKEFAPTARMYQASSSEMYGMSIDADGYQRESTKMEPCSPYGIGKLMGYNLVRHYRRAYALFCANGILFNHGSTRRGLNFVEQKIAKGVVEIALGKREYIEIGNLATSRDWGYSKEYVEAMWRILQQPRPLDLVIATGESVPVKMMLKYAFEIVGVEDWRSHVIIQNRYLRPEDLVSLRGDARKAMSQISWNAIVKWKQLIEILLKHWQEHYANQKNL